MRECEENDGFNDQQGGSETYAEEIFMVTAFPFAAEADDELSVDEGVRVRLLEKHGEWFVAETEDQSRRGLIPCSYLVDDYQVSSVEKGFNVDTLDINNLPDSLQSSNTGNWDSREAYNTSDFPVVDENKEDILPNLSTSYRDGSQANEFQESDHSRNDISDSLETPIFPSDPRQSLDSAYSWSTPLPSTYSAPPPPPIYAAPPPTPPLKSVLKSDEESGTNQTTEELDTKGIEVSIDESSFTSDVDSKRSHFNPPPPYAPPTPPQENNIASLPGLQSTAKPFCLPPLPSQETTDSKGTSEEIDDTLSEIFSKFEDLKERVSRVSLSSISEQSDISRQNDQLNQSIQSEPSVPTPAQAAAALAKATANAASEARINKTSHRPNSGQVPYKIQPSAHSSTIREEQIRKKEEESRKKAAQLHAQQDQRARERSKIIQEDKARSDQYDRFVRKRREEDELARTGLQKAISHAKTAIEADKAGRQQEAYVQFGNALDLFSSVLKNDINSNQHPLIIQRMQGYLRRMSVLESQAFSTGTQQKSFPVFGNRVEVLTTMASRSSSLQLLKEGDLLYSEAQAAEEKNMNAVAFRLCHQSIEYYLAQKRATKILSGKENPELASRLSLMLSKAEGLKRKI